MMNKNDLNFLDSKARIITCFGPVCEEMHRYVAETATRYELESKTEPIIVHINSPGGSAYECFGIVDILRSLEAPVMTVCTGIAMSAAVPILACGTPGQRKVGKHTFLMVHGVFSGMLGKIYEMDNELKHTKMLEKTYIEILSELTKKPKKVISALVRAPLDKYMTPTEAIKLGIADQKI